MEAGETLAAYAVEQWQGRVEWVLGLDLPEAGSMVQSRITGAFEGVRSALPDLPVESFVRMDGRGLRERSRKLIAHFLKRHPRDKHILVAATNDTSALGAVDAVVATGRERHVAIVGQDCIAEAMAELRKRRSPFIGTVSHETGAYGPRLMQLGLLLLRGRPWLPTTMSNIDW